MLLNYSELAMAVTPTRYFTSTKYFYDGPFLLARSRGRQLRRWLVDTFLLRLEPRVDDGSNDTERLSTFLMQSLMQNATKLLDDCKRRRVLGVHGSLFTNAQGVDKEISPAQIRKAIVADLSDLPDFTRLWSVTLPGVSYCPPLPPQGSHYIVERRVAVV